MQNFTVVLGLVLKAEPIGEYDRRVVLLTREKGKITVFARGARRQNNRFLAATTPFCFGEFKLYAGQNSYSLAEANITNYFEELRTDFELAYYGMYFMELADFYARENTDERQMLKLLYQSLCALKHSDIKKEFVRVVYEIKAIMLNGEFPNIPASAEGLMGADYAVYYLWNTPPEKVYSFQVSDVALKQMQERSEQVRKRTIDRPMKSLELIESLERNLGDAKG